MKKIKVIEDPKCLGLNYLGYSCEEYLKDTISKEFLHRLNNHDKNDFDIKLAIETTKSGEYSLFDSISYKHSLCLVTGSQLNSIYNLVEHFGYRYMKHIDFIEIRDSEKIPIDFKRLFFMLLYDKYCKVMATEYQMLKKSIKLLIT